MKPSDVLIAAVLSSLACLPLCAWAQESNLKDRLVGSWQIVSDSTTGLNGETRPVFGEHLHGVMVISADGYFALVATDSSRPQWKEKVRSKVAADEFKTTALGLFAQSGRWSIADGGKTLVKQITSAFNPANEGKTSRLPMRLQGNTLTITDPASPAAGGSALEVFQRVR